MLCDLCLVALSYVVSCCVVLCYSFLWCVLVSYLGFYCFILFCIVPCEVAHELTYHNNLNYEGAARNRLGNTTFVRPLIANLNVGNLKRPITIWIHFESASGIVEVQHDIIFFPYIFWNWKTVRIKLDDIFCIEMKLLRQGWIRSNYNTEKSVKAGTSKTEPQPVHIAPTLDIPVKACKVWNEKKPKTSICFGNRLTGFCQY